MSIEVVQFKPVGVDRLEELALVRDRAFAHRNGQLLPAETTPDALTRVQSRMNRVGAWTLAAVSEDDRILGLTLSHPHILDDDTIDYSTEHLSLLVAEPENWGQHIASRLVDYTIGHAVLSDRERLTLWTREENNDRARDFYVHKGFELTDLTKPDDWGRTMVQYQMQLPTAS